MNYSTQFNSTPRRLKLSLLAIICSTVYACGYLESAERQVQTSSSSANKVSSLSFSLERESNLFASRLDAFLPAAVQPNPTIRSDSNQSPVLVSEINSPAVAPLTIFSLMVSAQQPPAQAPASPPQIAPPPPASVPGSIGTPSGQPPKSINTRRLLSEKDFKLIGRFTVPDGGSGMDSTRYSRGAMTIGDEGDRPTIFITGLLGAPIAYGGDPNVRVGEINIPTTLSLSDKLNELPTGTFKQPMVDALEGKIGEVFDPATPNNAKLEVQIRGLFKYKNELLINAIMFYDNNDISVAGHFSRPLNLASKGQVDGPVRVAPQVGVRHGPGPMFKVPKTLQDRFGWLPVATGVNGLSIANSMSNGPGLILYDPDKIKGAKPRSSIPGQVLSSYPYPGKTFAEAMGFRLYMDDANPLNKNPWWTLTNHTKGGGLWPDTHETVVFAGLRGMGAPWYGNPKAPPTWGVVDPVSIAQGPHAFPYEHILYLFDQNEYIDVQNGLKKPNEVKAYGTVSLPDPFGPASTAHAICGSAHDTIAKRMYIMKCNNQDADGKAYIEVYQLPD